MPCPDPPDRRVRACFPHRPTDGRPEPLHARVIKDEVQNHDLIVTLSIGSDAGLGKDWHGYVLTGETEEPLADLFLLRIAKRVSIARVHLTVDQIHDNTRVLLTPPN